MAYPSIDELKTGFSGLVKFAFNATGEHDERTGIYTITFPNGAEFSDTDPDALWDRAAKYRRAFRRLAGV